MSGRNQILDVLRAIAVFLVLFRHIYVYSTGAVPSNVVVHLLQRGGWSGVDLFFVLSGFLISQLLFKEHKKLGVISFKTFFIRRGFKIYPAYYCMTLITGVILCLLQASGTGPGQMFRLSLPWLLYVQDYFQTPLTFVWGHTWSLAVEEQFYILLPLLLILLTKTKADKDDPFRSIPIIFIAVGLTCLSARIANATITPFNNLLHLASFHTRIDSLFCGVCVSYFYHYRPGRLFDAAKRFRFLFLSLGIILIIPPFVLEIADSPFIYTVGYTLLYVGSGLVIVATISDPPRRSLPIRTLAYIGSHSYSIYLWHFPIAWLVYQVQTRWMHLPVNWYVAKTVYLATSVVFGIGIANLVEFPVLRLRDRLFPSRSS